MEEDAPWEDRAEEASRAAASAARLTAACIVEYGDRQGAAERGRAKG